MEHTPYNYKIIVVGDAFVGKTCFIQELVEAGSFSSVFKGTIGVDFSIKSLTVGNKEVKLHLFDIAGQERFANMTKVYYRSACAAMIAVDLSQPLRRGLRMVLKWKEDIDSKVFKAGTRDTPIPVMLLATKSDLVTDVDEEALEAFCQTRGFVGYRVTSSKSGTNIEATGLRLAKLCLAEYPDGPVEPKTKMSVAERVDEMKECCQS